MRSSVTKIRLHVLWVLFLTLSVTILISPALARLIDFETYPGGAATNHLDPVNTQFSAWGISQITSEDDAGNTVDAVIRQDQLPWLNYASGISALAPWVGTPGGPGYGPAQAPINVYLSTPSDYFSIYAMDVGWNGLTVDAYSTDLSLLDSVVIDGTGRNHDGPPGEPDWLDFIEFTTTGISMVSFYQNYLNYNDLGTEGYLLDDMTFTGLNEVPIPEPLTLLSSALGITAFLRYRKKRKHAG